jgi:hypothetical protein
VVEGTLTVIFSRHPKRRSLFAGSLALALAGASVHAGTMTWTGTNNWNSTNNWSFGTVPGATDGAVIQAGNVILTNPVQVLSLTNSATLTFNGWSNVLTAGNVMILNGAVVTHGTNTAGSAPWTPDAGVFIVCTNLTVQTNGRINANAMGYRGGGQYANGYGPGQGIYSGNRGGGGGYGGQGGVGDAVTALGGVTHGSAIGPNWPGSGGAGCWTTVLGGEGGGYIRIAASGAIRVDGVISAVGSNVYTGDNGSGGGSGGSIYLNCGNLLGAGAIQAKGGIGGYSGGYIGGGGGGGRIALYVYNGPYFTAGNLLFSTTAPAGGIGYSNGLPGTIYRDFKPRGTVFRSW